MRTRMWLPTCGALVLVLLGVAPVSGAPPSPQPGCSATPAQLGADPKNVILMIGDGMGPEHVELGDMFGGPLAMRGLDLDGPGFAGTNDYYGATTDSAAAATALATGCKTYNGAISVDVNYANLETAWERAHAGGAPSGLATGILSSVFLVDATPGVWAAHSVSRSNYSDIAKQQARSGVEVLLGAGAQYYLPQGAYGTGDVDLIAEMQANGYTYVRKATELAKTTGPKVLGFFGGTAMTYDLDRALNRTLTEPTLAQMTSKAIELLSKDRDGFFLVVEGGGIDWLAHKKDAAGVMHEVDAFDDAVAVARSFADKSRNTLLVVTADHETGGLTVSPSANIPFLSGVKATTDIIWSAIEGGSTVEQAMKTYAGISRLSAQEKQTILSCGSDLGIADVLNARAGVTWGWGACEGAEHTPTQVQVFATGPGAAAFNGTFENTRIGQLLLQAVA